MADKTNGNGKRQVNPRSLENLKLGAEARNQGKQKFTCTLLPETINWLKARGNASLLIDTLVADAKTKRKYEKHTSSKSDEHYTPLEIVKAVLDCFDGCISLDPCSNSHTSPNIPSERLFTIDDDGLTKLWGAETLYMNPPYSKVKPWLKKLLSEYHAGNVHEAIALVKADTSTQWFKELFQHSTAICFVDHRLKFLTDKDQGSATFASAAIYFGQNADNFKQAFQSLGRCIVTGTTHAHN